MPTFLIPVTASEDTAAQSRAKTPVRPSAKKPARKHPKMLIQSERRDIKFVVPYAPNEVNHANLAQVWRSVERGGRTPLLLRSGRPLETLSFDLFLAARDRQKNTFTASVARMIDGLQDLANTRQRIQILSLGSNITGWWRITDLSVTVTARQHLTNEPIRATATIEITRASDISVDVGPVRKSKAPRIPPGTGIRNQPSSERRRNRKGGETATSTRIHIVRSGDTLSKIALKWYGRASTDAMQTIADANKMRVTSILRVGQRLVIPRRVRDISRSGGTNLPGPTSGPSRPPKCPHGRVPVGTWGDGDVSYSDGCRWDKQTNKIIRFVPPNL